MRIKLASRVVNQVAPFGRRDSILAGATRFSLADQAQRFFEKFMVLEECFDPALAALYADEARVILSTTSARGVESRQVFSGCQWKWRLSQRLEQAKALGDGNLYSDISYSLRGNRVHIRADRYSTLGGYTDHGYYMILQETTSGRFLIMEECSLKFT
ncbi:hypothetical protein [Aestuariispira insulae]|uniref:DUF4440 domain-containing protein n=1 Tax=Aestuariispira insulae TaxID=1461337 RepID=A0A3D9HWH1_9PROT|nr:hypothetical protein [Aestuariispira insulae]RED53848.1 hypothetical protein DFP90_101647 [Aestuariispira insulae]